MQHIFLEEIKTEIHFVCTSRIFTEERQKAFENLNVRNLDKENALKSIMYRV